MVKHDAVELVTSAAFKKEIIMEKIDVTTLNDNVFTTIGKEWMLVAAGNEEKFNMMTASWGCLGWLWNRPVAIVYIRPERYTHEFIEANDTMSLVFLATRRRHARRMRSAVLNRAETSIRRRRPISHPLQPRTAA